MAQDTRLASAGSSAAYRSLPPHPPLHDEAGRQSEHAAESRPPDSPPTRYSRVWMVTGGVLALVSVTVLFGLVWWAIGRGDAAQDAIALDEPPDVEAAPEGAAEDGFPESGVLPRGADEEFFADPDGFFERFGREFPEDLSDRFGFPEDFFGEEGPFHAPDGEFGFTIPDGRFQEGLGGRFGRLQDELDSLGIPSLDLVLPDDAIVRGFSFSSVGVGDDRTLGLTVAFEIDGVRSRLTVSSTGDAGQGTEVDLDGTPAVLDEQGRLMWMAGGGTVTFTLESQDLDEAALVDLGTEIERAMR